MAWSLTVVLWEDPITGAYTGYRQRALSRELDDQMRSWQRSGPPAAGRQRVSADGQAVGPPIPLEALRGMARRYRIDARPGAAIARLTIPAVGVDAIAVNGTEPPQLRAGPGRHLASAMPGERRLVYVAGHRTTFGAPFSRIDELSAGDEVRLDLPYATILYRVTGSTIVDDEDVSVLEPGTRERLALQACHPRFFASHRYIVWARPTAAFEPVSGQA